MPLHNVAKGALIGGGVGLLLAAARRSSSSSENEDAPGTGARIFKSVAEGALAGAAVALVLDRRLRARATELIIEGAPVVVEAVSELARRYEPSVERFAETALDRAVDAYEVAYPRVVEAYEAARPRLDDALEIARDRALSLSRQ